MAGEPSAPGPGRDTLFLSELDFHYQRDGASITGEVALSPALVGHDGWPLASLLATIGDVMLGTLANAISDSLPLTSDLNHHTFHPTGVQPIRAIGEMTKVGRTLIVGEIRFHDPDDRLVAYCSAGFLGSPRPDDLRYDNTPVDLIRFGDGSGPAFTERFDRFLGIRVTAPGVAEAPRRDDLIQGSSTFQGGVVCAVAETAAESVLDAPIVGLETRYLSSIRLGSARATATRLDTGLARVEVIDTDRSDRVASVVIARSVTR